jgi:hypothetical protein
LEGKFQNIFESFAARATTNSIFAAKYQELFESDKNKH